MESDLEAPLVPFSSSFTFLEVTLRFGLLMEVSPVLVNLFLFEDALLTVIGAVDPSVVE